MKILVTGVAGFIGMHVAEKLLARGDSVVGVDNLNSYYDPLLKSARLRQLAPYDRFRFEFLNIADRPAMENLFKREKFDQVVHLAAQVGVRYSLDNPHAYIDSNIVGFMNVLEGCRNNAVGHLVYASSSSVYGGNTKTPFCEEDPVDLPVSLYAATKKANELMAHSYTHLYGLPTSGLRYFTVYGPWGRPDMSPWLFTSAILEGRAIDIFNHGEMRRDFTNISDIVDGTLSVLDRATQIISGSVSSDQSSAINRDLYKIYNVASQTTIDLMTFIETIEKAVGRKAIKRFLPMKPGDVLATYASVDNLLKDTGFEPKTTLEVGIPAWIDWYKKYSSNTE